MNTTDPRLASSAWMKFNVIVKANLVNPRSPLKNDQQDNGSRLSPAAAQRKTRVRFLESTLYGSRFPPPPPIIPLSPCSDLSPEIAFPMRFLECLHRLDDLFRVEQAIIGYGFRHNVAPAVRTLGAPNQVKCNNSSLRGRSSAPDRRSVSYQPRPTALGIIAPDPCRLKACFMLKGWV